ncbi:MAG: alpha/beta hydrolase, partial [Chloroflexi bacterium]|nr:alpha/beta hydrolase [Chloroflexota bacterium]
DRLLFVLETGCRDSARALFPVPALSGIKVPALVITGDEDSLFPAVESEAMRDGIAGARYVSIPSAGHLSNLDQPAEFNHAVRDFVQSLT